MKFSWKVLESILREGKAQREHTSWKLENFKMTQTPEDTERVSKGWRKPIVPAEKTRLRCCLSVKEEQTFSRTIPPLPFLLTARCQSLCLSDSSEKLFTVTAKREHPVQCPVFGSLGKKEDLTTHSAWVSETRDSRKQVRRTDYICQHLAAGIR